MSDISVYQAEKITEALEQLSNACLDESDGVKPSKKFLLDLLCGAALDQEDCGTIERSWDV